MQDSALPAGTTTYTYGVPPNDGFYTVSSNTNHFDWLIVDDVTPNDTNGRMLIVNSDFSAGEFYRTTINGLCENTTYEFSSWLINLSPSNGFCGNNVIPINVKFEIWDSTDTNLLAFGDTGNITSTTTANWQQYALVFQTIPNQTSVILKMINNGIGGCGNDLAIDDIVFKTCGDSITVNDPSNNNNVSLCSSQTPYSTTITVIPDFSVFSTHFYQWEESSDGITWTNIVGEINPSITTSGITSTVYYRCKVAESPINLNNAFCNTVSEVYQVTVNQMPVTPTLACWEMATFNDATCSWNITGTQPTQPTLDCWETATFNTTTCLWEVTGTQPIQPTLACWETATFNLTSCIWEITGDQPIDAVEESVFLCDTGDVTLQANSAIFNPTYMWSNGASTEFIIVNIPGIYTVEITDGCSTRIITYNVSQVGQPEINQILSDGNSIIIETNLGGDLEYSLDGLTYQNTPIFFNIEGGKYRVRVRNDCGETLEEFIHLFIPKYFTPNNDTFHDYFEIKSIECYESSQVRIFDRYGKLLYNTNNTPLIWDGTIDNNPLPASDYWYIINIEEQQIIGHFTLKR